jgi:hypothetical protein
MCFKNTFENITTSKAYGEMPKLQKSKINTKEINF